MAVMNKDSMHFTHIYIGNKACKIIPPFLSRKNLLEDSKTLFFGLVIFTYITSPNDEFIIISYYCASIKTLEDLNLWVSFSIVINSNDKYIRKMKTDSWFETNFALFKNEQLVFGNTKSNLSKLTKFVLWQACTIEF